MNVKNKTTKKCFSLTFEDSFHEENGVGRNAASAYQI
jgi:hypothetical protein